MLERSESDGGDKAEMCDVIDGSENNNSNSSIVIVTLSSIDQI